jgi:hypothetical protein
LDPFQTLVALSFWIVFAAWITRIFYLHQQQALIVPLNLYFAVLMLAVVSAYNAERALRRGVPWLFIASFFFLLSDAIFGNYILSLTLCCFNTHENIGFDEFIAPIPLASISSSVVHYSAQIIVAVGVLSVPSQGVVV